MQKHSFQEVEECQNDRLKEELSFDILNSIKRSREGGGVLTLYEIARIIQEGVGEDAAILAGLLYVMNVNRNKRTIADLMKEQDNFIFNQIIK